MKIENENLTLDSCTNLQGLVDKINDLELSVIRIWKTIDTIEKLISDNNLNNILNV